MTTLPSDNDHINYISTHFPLYSLSSGLDCILVICRFLGEDMLPALDHLIVA